MKKILFSFLFVTLFIGLGYTIFFNKSIDVTHTIDKEAIRDKNFLNDKQAVLYFSTTADQDMDDKGLSFAVFIDEQGKADAYQMKGLELGGISFSENSLMLVDKNKLRLVGKTFKEFTMETPQYTGERMDFLKEQKLHVSIFNTGVSQDGGYDSNVWFGNEQGFHKGNIPYYILSSGITPDEALILTQDIEKNEYFLKSVYFTDHTLHVKDLIMLQNSTNSEFASLSPILEDKNFYYLILNEFVSETSDNTVLYRIDKETLSQDKIILASYTNKKNPASTIPYNVKNSSHLYASSLYYMNGLGEVISFNTKTDAVETAFALKDAPQDGVRHNEELFFKDNLLYVLRYDKKSKEKYRIEVYSLPDGRKVDEKKIKGLNHILQSVKRKSIYSYDFKILK
jgi:hypothetical protein